MSWLLWGLGIIGFFFVVGKLTSRSQRSATSVTTNERTVTHKTKRDQYLPWGDEPYHHIHLFKLFGTDAGLAWNDGDERVFVYCISRFSKGEPQTKTYSVYCYGTQDRAWHDPPKGAANECLKEIKKVVK